MMERTLFTIEPHRLASIVGEAREVTDDEIPKGYSLFRRDIQLLSGKWEPAFYSTREDLQVDPDAMEKVAPSIIEGFTWVLLVADFQDSALDDNLETADDDRALEIGQMMSYALTCGLAEAQVLECFRVAFMRAKDAQRAQLLQD